MAAATTSATAGSSARPSRMVAHSARYTFLGSLSLMTLSLNTMLPNSSGTLLMFKTSFLYCKLTLYCKLAHAVRLPRCPAGLLRHAQKTLQNGQPGPGAFFRVKLAAQHAAALHGRAHGPPAV